MRLAAVLLAVVASGACGESSSDPPAPDAMPPLPGVEAYLAVGDYDCTATGPALAPARPHALDCFADPACDARLVAGHRMAAPFAPENSLAALRAGILLGEDIAEIDVRTSADGVLVVIHDADIDRTTTGVGDVEDMTVAELQAVPLVAQTDNPPGEFGCLRIPTLAEVFAVSRDQIVVELELKGAASAAAAAEYLRDQDLYGQAFLLCDPGECAAARAAVPDVPIMTRPHSADEVAGELDYDPPPLLVHIDPVNTFLNPTVVAQIHGAGARVYANAFLPGDGAALASGDLSGYIQLYDDGVDVAQAQYPNYALQALGRLNPRP